MTGVGFGKFPVNEDRTILCPPLYGEMDFPITEPTISPVKDIFASGARTEP
ncbi:hypothetical protein D3C78_1791690 [compost metagenome]